MHRWFEKCGSRKADSYQSRFRTDVAFEILSPSDSPSQIQRKRLDCQRSGVIQVWFDLEKRLVELISGPAFAVPSQGSGVDD